MNQHPFSLQIQQYQYPTEEYLPDISSSFFPTTPISPPAPHRRAPRPPVYSPRRNRARHINMKEPAQLGLFTVLEFEEDVHRMMEVEESRNLNILYSLPWAAPSSEIFPSPSPSPSPSHGRSSPINVPRDIDEDMEMDEKLNRLSWSSKGSLTSQATSSLTEGESEGFLISTPLLENEDPFGWSNIPLHDGSDSFEPDIEMTEDTIGGHLFNTQSQSRPTITLAESIKSGSTRRPPPLALNLSTRFLTPTTNRTPTSANMLSAISNASTVDSDLIITPKTANTPGLLPALPILSSIEWASKVYSPTTPTKSKKQQNKRTKRKSPDDTCDLAMALEDLLTSCGEKFELNSSSSSSCSESESEFSGPVSVTNSSESDNENENENENGSGFESRSLRFPLPPIRSPKTPSPTRKSFIGNGRPLTPYAPKKDRRSSSITRGTRDSPLALKGDHSFLYSLSMGTDHCLREEKKYRSSGSSAGSSIGSDSSRKSLPGRKSLPMEWMKI
ncbi:hypothetical protein I203_107105 [Kwoniella mangroviensis CBS 8507]|uniref:hypothetical protein n=1 Tax=Kwoniella mangroviensis CBS 8507 TaxID=1296122 RepID=UPI00080D1340|nr:uncharacterized protein I203_01853 [Kwoniella mangroviensis CBS 8507]OCF68470.1 hypothetical protein I203_01853 [Kwoniella mangroviensis CBS 8507]